MMSAMLKSLWGVISLGLILLGMVFTSTPVAAQADDPEGVVRGIVDALNEGEIDAALALVADDAVITLFPAPPNTTGVFAGKEEIRAWWETFTASNGSAEITNFSAQGETATWTATVTEDGFRDLGLGSLEFNGAGITQGGLLKTYAWSMTDAAMARLQMALMRSTNAMVAQRYMEELWNQGNVDVADELLSPDFVDHTPRPGMGSDREAIKQDVAGFHTQFPDQSAQFRIDDLIATDEKVVVRGTLMMPAADGSAPAQNEGPGILVVLSLQEGQIVERWATFIGWGE
jgi:ketosteroid isomerase-like protein